MTLDEIKEEYQAIEDAYEANELSAEEYETLLQGLLNLETINTNAEESQNKQDLRTAIETSIKVVSLLA